MESNQQRGLISYFAHNSVAANLLMVFIIIMGIVSFFFIQRQMFPNIEVNYINVSASYPGLLLKRLKRVSYSRWKSHSKM